MYNLEHINKQLDLNEMPDNNKFPDPILHKQLSFLKSAIRILACAVGGVGLFLPAFVIIGVAEVVGILEELV
jgi:hypothetical protein